MKKFKPGDIVRVNSHSGVDCMEGRVGVVAGNSLSSGRPYVKFYVDDEIYVYYYDELELERQLCVSRVMVIGILSILLGIIVLLLAL